MALRVFRAGTPEQDGLMRWLLEHRELLSREWMIRETVSAMLPPGLAGQPGEARARALETLVVDALDREDYDRAFLVLDAVMEALGRADPWTEAQANLLHALGFALWNVGQPGESIPRKSSIPPRLENIQALLHPRLRRLWGHLRGLRDARAVELYAQVIGSLAGRAGDAAMLSLLYDVMEDGHKEGLWTEDALYQLAVDLSIVRERYAPTCAPVPDDTQSGSRWVSEWADALAITGAAMLVERHEVGGLGRYLASAMLFEDALPHFREQRWLRPESYAEVRRAISERG